MARGINWSKQRRVARGQYEIANGSHREAAAYVRHVMGEDRAGAPRARQQPSDKVMRDWSLPCDDCGHAGMLRSTLIQMRRWIAEGMVKCTQCGSVKRLKTPI